MATVPIPPPPLPASQGNVGSNGGAWLAPDGTPLTSAQLAAGGQPPVYDPSKGGWVDPATGAPQPAPGFVSNGSWNPQQVVGKDVNGNPIPVSAYSTDPAAGAVPDGGSLPGTIGQDVKRTGVTKIAPAVLAGAGLGGSGGAGSVDTSAISKAAAASTALSNQFNGEYQNFQPTTAPQAAAFNIQDTAQAQQQAPIQAGQSTAARIAATVQAMRQPTIQSPQVTAAQAAPTTLGPTALAGQTNLAPAALATSSQLAPTALATSASIDPTQQAQFRAQQEGLVSGLNGAIAGTDPSVAAIMLKQQTDANIANQYALAQAANGQNTGLAQRQAQIDAGNVSQTAIGQQALLRAQEIATARGQLGSVLDSGRTQDLTLAQGQAGLQQQTALANQGAVNTASATQLGADVQTKLANAGFLNTQSMTQAQLNQAIALANAGFKNTATTTQAQLDQATSALNTQQQNQVGLANAGNQLQANTTNATLGQQVALANAAAGNATNSTNATLANATGIANANNQTGANTASSQLANQVALANAASTNQTNQTNATLGTQTSVANAGNATTTNAQNITAKNDLATNALTGSGQAITGTVGAAQAQATEDAAKAQADAAKVGGLATTGAALISKSDRRAKRDIADGEMDVEAFLRDLKAYKFKYKDGHAEGEVPGQRYGIMAQDLEKSPMGRSLVRETSTGKAIDVQQAAGAALAALASLNKRVSAVEGR